MLPENTLVSMNAWGLRGSLLPHLADALAAFPLDAEAKSECLLPETMHQLIQSSLADVQVVRSDAAWFGLTFAEDLPAARKTIAAYTAAGAYPTPLFGS